MPRRRRAERQVLGVVRTGSYSGAARDIERVLSACLALEQRFLWMAVGYFGVIEYVPPRRLKYLVTAMGRNGLTDAAIEYHRLHAVIDSHHATGWFNHVAIPAVLEKPS
jgi:hypothetical protein